VVATAPATGAGTAAILSLTSLIDVILYSYNREARRRQGGRPNGIGTTPDQAELSHAQAPIYPSPPSLKNATAAIPSKPPGTGANSGKTMANRRRTLPDTHRPIQKNGGSRKTTGNIDTGNPLSSPQPFGDLTSKT
jgi:hypothetical protein